MTVYIVLKRGVYLQGLLGVYEYRADAIEMARRCAEREPDTYHDIEVHAAEVNRDINIDRDTPAIASFKGTIAILFAMILLSSGCAVRELITPTPLLPAQMAANAVVLLEDSLEDPDLDATESSPLELLADLVSAPAHLFTLGLAVQASTLWSVGEWMVGAAPQPDAHLTQTMDWIGPRMASAPPPTPTPPSPTPTMDDWRRTRGWIRY
jgi:hypothetical protein